MESLKKIFIRFTIWFFSWQLLLKVLDYFKITTVLNYAIFLIGAIAIYYYYSKEQSEDNE
jgi:hypothetical protein